MDKREWWTVHKALHATAHRLDADIKASLDGLGLSHECINSCSSEASAIRGAADDARQQLAQLLQQVLGDGHGSAATIAALPGQAARFAQQLNDIKAGQRAEYGSLLRQEQQLAEELSSLQLSWLFEQHQQEGQQHVGAAVDDWARGTPLRSPSAHAHSHRVQLQEEGAADCTRSSPDRLQRQPPGASSSPNKRGGGCTAASNSSSSDGRGGGSSLLPEVQAHDAFLVRHGPTGGWHPDDHATFVRVLKAHKGDYNAALAVAVDALPLHDRQSVIAHCRWHADLCELDMRRRIALVNWRSARDAAKAAWRAQAEALGDATAAGSAQDPCEGQSAAAAADQQQKEARHAQQQLLTQWRLDQQRAREAAAKAAAEQRRLEQVQQQQQWRQRREELQQQLQQARAARQEQEACVSAQQAGTQAAAEPAPLGPEQRQRLRQRNAAAVERQRQLLASRQAKQDAAQRAQQQLLAATAAARPRVERDPSRLLSATAAAAARAAAAAAEQAPGTARGGSSRGRPAGGFVLHVAHKAVPAWIAGVQQG